MCSTNVNYRRTLWKGSLKVCITVHMHVCMYVCIPLILKKRKKKGREEEKEEWGEVEQSIEVNLRDILGYKALLNLFTLPG